MSYKSLKRSGCPFEEIAREAFKKSNENDKKENPLSPTDTLSSDGADGKWRWNTLVNICRKL